MNKATLDVVSMGMAEYAFEEAEKAKEAKAMMEAEIDAAWKQHDEAFKMEVDQDLKKAWDLRSELEAFWVQVEESALFVSAFHKELLEVNERLTFKARATKRRKAEAKAKRDCVKVATIMVRSHGKLNEYDCYMGDTNLSHVKSIRGNHGVFKSRTCKASRLIKLAEKATGGEFDLAKVG